jgi:cellulose synthase/poly-beta-1,6-N-acetylglucosamine synthase-like glycosyltransferase
LIDKPFESAFKFIHVLPGAFSGYNMEALRPKKK